MLPHQKLSPTKRSQKGQWMWVSSLFKIPHDFIPISSNQTFFWFGLLYHLVRMSFSLSNLWCFLIKKSYQMLQGLNRQKWTLFQFSPTIDHEWGRTAVDSGRSKNKTKQVLHSLFFSSECYFNLQIKLNLILKSELRYFCTIFVYQYLIFKDVENPVSWKLYARFRNM